MPRATAGDSDTLSDAGSSTSSTDYSTCPTPDPELVESYDALMSSLLHIPDDVRWALLDVAQESANQSEEIGVDDQVGNVPRVAKRPMTKAEKQNAKKKRRKEREKAARAVGDESHGRQADAAKQEVTTTGASLLVPRGRITADPM
jgi:hypothetical protein